MTVRYVTAVCPARSRGGNNEPFLTSETVYEKERAPVSTGIVDQNGVMLYRLDEMEPIGFMAPTRTKS